MSDSYKCSDPACDGSELVVVEATPEMLQSSKGMEELMKIVDLLGVVLDPNEIGIGLCSNCSMTYYIAL